MHANLIALLAAALLLAPAMTAAQTPAIEEPWSAGGLHGTITRSADHTRGPAVLIIAGSGPTDRNGNGPGLATDCYKLLASGLAADGILSLRYDKRGIGESRALATRESDVLFDHFVTDAVAALQSLTTRPGVSSVVIAGHSEGGIIALAAAARSPVAGIALLAAPGRGYLTLMRSQLKGRLPPDLDASATAILDALESGQRVADISPPLMPLFRPSVQPFLISAGRHDPAAMLAQLTTPVLVVHAGRDLQIAAEDFAALRTARSDLRILELPEANHILKASPADRDGNIALYRNPAAPLDPALMPALVAFTRSVAR
jgi:alpha-beta hydrolase superfamily lysophospholipase